MWRGGGESYIISRDEEEQVQPRQASMMVGRTVEKEQTGASAMGVRVGAGMVLCTWQHEYMLLRAFAGDLVSLRVLRASVARTWHVLMM